MMVGRSVELVVSKEAAKPGAPVLELKDLTVQDDRGLTVVDHVVLTVRAGEIVALAGVQGNGQTELVEAIAGLLLSPAAGPLSGRGPHERHAPGGLSGPEWRTSPRTVRSTASCCPCRRGQPGARHLRQAPSPVGAREPGAGKAGRRTQAPGVRHPCHLGLTPGGDAVRAATSRRSWWRASCPGRSSCSWRRSRPGGSTSVRSSTCTGGSSPSATGERESCSISSELDEVLALGDRIAVMYRGRIIGVVPRASAERIGLMMAGVEAVPSAARTSSPASTDRLRSNNLTPTAGRTGA